MDGKTPPPLGQKPTFRLCGRTITLSDIRYFGKIAAIFCYVARASWMALRKARVFSVMI